MNIGAQLRASREAKGLSIDALSKVTRVQPRILAAIERNDVSSVPPRPFGRGFVRAYAQEIGLNPEDTARAYFAQFAPLTRADAPSAPSAPVHEIVSMHGWSSAAVAALIVVAVLALWTARTAKSPDAASPRAVGTVGTTSTRPVDDAAPARAASAESPAVEAIDRSAATATGGASAPAGSSTPAASNAAAHSAPLNVVLTATRPCWVTANADGRRALFQFITPGSPVTLQAARDITFRVGDAGAVTWQINGRDAGSLGRAGQVRDLRVTPVNAATVR